MASFRDMDGDKIRRVLDECHADIREIAIRYPDLMRSLEEQYEMDKKMYGRLPTFICVQTNSGVINTTIRYSKFVKLLPIWKARPDILDSKMVDDIVNTRNIALRQDGRGASELFGMPPTPGANN